MPRMQFQLGLEILNPSEESEGAGEKAAVGLSHNITELSLLHLDIKNGTHIVNSFKHTLHAGPKSRKRCHQ